jgi:hypothetical protein
MFKLTKYTLIVAAMVAAVGAPSSAYAMFINGGGKLIPASAAPFSALRAGHAARGGETSGTRGRLAGPAAGAQSGARHAISSSNGFHWGDAGIGAAVVLVLITVGSRAAVVIRRRVRHPLTS